MSGHQRHSTAQYIAGIILTSICSGNVNQWRLPETHDVCKTKTTTNNKPGPLSASFFLDNHEKSYWGLIQKEEGTTGPQKWPQIYLSFPNTSLFLRWGKGKENPCSWFVCLSSLSPPSVERRATRLLLWTFRDVWEWQDDRKVKFDTQEQRAWLSFCYVSSSRIINHITPRRPVGAYFTSYNKGKREEGKITIAGIDWSLISSHHHGLNSPLKLFFVTFNIDIS